MKRQEADEGEGDKEAEREEGDEETGGDSE
jgi:hypothetical protein